MFVANLANIFLRREVSIEFQSWVTGRFKECANVYKQRKKWKNHFDVTTQKSQKDSMRQLAWPMGSLKLSEMIQLI
jgi:hypothetical protein